MFVDLFGIAGFCSVKRIAYFIRTATPRVQRLQSNNNEFFRQSYSVQAYQVSCSKCVVAEFLGLRVTDDAAKCNPMTSSMSFAGTVNRIILSTV